MKRDMELIRKIVLAIEDSPTGYAPKKFELAGCTAEQLGYHAYLLVDGGLATGHDVTDSNCTSPFWKIRSLTWAGHEFADASRDDSRWKKALDFIKDKAGTASIAMLTQVLTSLMKKSLGIP